MTLQRKTNEWKATSGTTDVGAKGVAVGFAEGEVLLPDMEMSLTLPPAGSPPQSGQKVAMRISII